MLKQAGFGGIETGRPVNNVKELAGLIKDTQAKLIISKP